MMIKHTIDEDKVIVSSYPYIAAEVKDEHVRFTYDFNSNQLDELNNIACLVVSKSQKWGLPVLKDFNLQGVNGAASLHNKVHYYKDRYIRKYEPLGIKIAINCDLFTVFEYEKHKLDFSVDVPFSQLSEEYQEMIVFESKISGCKKFTIDCEQEEFNVTTVEE